MSADLIDFAAIERELEALRLRPGVIVFTIEMAVSDAERQRAYRARQRAGVEVIAVPINGLAVIDALIECRRMTEDEALDRRLVAAAISELLDDWRKAVTRDAKDPVRRAKVSPLRRRP